MAEKIDTSVKVGDRFGEEIEVISVVNSAVRIKNPSGAQTVLAIDEITYRIETGRYRRIATEDQHSVAIDTLTSLRTMLGFKPEDVVKRDDYLDRVRQLLALERRLIESRVGTELVTDSYEEP